MTAHPEKWPAGTPCWVDIMAGDLDRTQAFYADLLGWEYTPSEAEFGGYCNALVGDRLVAGLSPTMEGMEQAPHVWSVYLATDDIAATGAAAEANGAKALFEPMQIGSFGSMGLWVDPTGAAFGAWQSGEHTGFGLVDEAGAVNWCDLMTTDASAAREFYARVFGFTYTEMGGADAPYSLFSVPGGERAGGGIGAQTPDHAGMPPGWGVTFQVDDVDARAARVSAAGGVLRVDPYDFEWGRLCLASGPDGEPFGLITPSGSM